MAPSRKHLLGSPKRSCGRDGWSGVQVEESTYAATYLGPSRRSWRLRLFSRVSVLARVSWSAIQAH